MRLAAGSADAKRIDAALALWRQGDVALEERWFAHTAKPAVALTPEAAASSGDAPVAVVGEVDGLVVVTQTCDIVRECVERPFIEVSPLVEVGSHDLGLVRKGKRPRYHLVPATSGRRLVVDLDRTMTVEKGVVADWKHTPGCATDDERRSFARALARKRSRAAFPGDFVLLTNNLQKRIQDKHGKNDEEGSLLAALREIRVGAVPGWEASSVDLWFWFVLEEHLEPSARESALRQLDLWRSRVNATGRFLGIHFELTTLERMTARDHVFSEVLDLEHLSA